MIVIKSTALRKVLKIFIPCVLIPAAIIFGETVLKGKRYAAVSLIAAILALVLFIAGVERKKSGSRRLVITAIMTALAVLGRFIPVFKPVTAVAVMSGMYLGKEAGFLTGAISALISNFYFGQGPWTPFQMLSWGLIGYLAGVIQGVLKKSKVCLAAYGAAAGIVYSLIMDVWTVLWYSGGVSLELYLAAMVTALPHTVLYAVSNVVFLLVMSNPFGSRMERIKIKYGI